MPKVDIRDDKGVVESSGSGFFRNGTQCEASATSLDYVLLIQRMSDITKNNSGTYLVCPLAGEVVRIYATNNKALVADDGAPTLTIQINDGAGGGFSTIKQLSFTAESAEATVIDSGAITSSNTVTAGGIFKILSTGGGDTDNSIDTMFEIVVQRT